MTEILLPSSATRGPTDHNVRDQIVAAATEHFAHYGYEKTTVSDLAKAIGFSKAYIYKFFDSKRAIGEVICGNCLGSIIIAVQKSIGDSTTASDRLRSMFGTVVTASMGLFSNERKLYSVAAFAASEHWHAAAQYEDRLIQFLRQILKEGRDSGEFECTTPLDETVSAVYLVLRPYVNPLLLQYQLDQAEAASGRLTRLLLRSLAP
ncbi:TetR/AcrR family transcriptional regulator [Pseudomonas moraviensis subsp. stanleyae]|uniref:TetR/AcrR family transcriptional regulator n=1 Tax=Pseudomonas moraviensis TaxID=321662 RepID=UPI002E2FAD15|nr:TetR/AcrR family transcriptional regulator [Pseudomonas moraviensis]MED7666673.1 TetR/AcrR family transcriptional regulator [Pseudomonas moraviensis subsp. stanleyae]